MGLLALAMLVGVPVLLGVVAPSGHADPNLPLVKPHRHWINGVQVGPDICDNPGNMAIWHAFSEFHNNLHIATQYSIGPAAPGLHNGIGAEIVSTACSVTTPPQ